MREYTNTGNKDTRSGFGEGLTELGRNNKKIVALCADLTGSLKMNDFKKENPDRFIQVGVAEANMIGIAAGLTIGGKIPFTGTFANFSTGRVYDQIRQSVAYSSKNVKIPNTPVMSDIIGRLMCPLLDLADIWVVETPQLTHITAFVFSSFPQF